MKRTLLIVALVCMFIAGFTTGYMVGKPRQPQSIITMETVLTSLQNRGFLVTKTYVFNTPVTITETEGSVWKDMLFGQVIEAQGMMEVNIGTDLQKLTKDDVVIAGDKITVSIPKSSKFDARLIGPIALKNKQGLLKRIFDNDNGYNQALDALQTAAETAAKDETLLADATNASIDEVQRLVAVFAPGKTVEVIVK